MDVFRDERGKARDGNRGGLGLFKWETVVADEQKECYLGNSVKASTGRWQNHKNLHWFIEPKSKTNSVVELDELAQIKRMEAEHMAQALGAIVPIQQPSAEILQDNLDQNSRNDKVVGLGLKGDRRKEVEWAAKREHQDRKIAKIKRRAAKEKRREVRGDRDTDQTLGNHELQVNLSSRARSRSPRARYSTSPRNHRNSRSRY